MNAVDMILRCRRYQPEAGETSPEVYRLLLDHQLLPPNEPSASGEYVLAEHEARGYYPIEEEGRQEPQAAAQAAQGGNQ